MTDMPLFGDGILFPRPLSVFCGTDRMRGDSSLKDKKQLLGEIII